MRVVDKVKAWFVKRAIISAIGGDMFEKLRVFFSGKKSYFIALIGAILGILEAYGVKIPEYVYIILGSMGVATMRAAIGEPTQKK